MWLIKKNLSNTDTQKYLYPTEKNIYMISLISLLPWALLVWL